MISDQRLKRHSVSKILRKLGKGNPILHFYVYKVKIKKAG